MKKFHGALLGGVLLVSGCSFADESLWPSLTGEDPAGTATEAEAAARTETAQQPAVNVSSQPQLGTQTFQPLNVTPGQPTGTFVGEKVVELRQELSALQGAIARHNGILQETRGKIIADSQRYHNALAAMNARLQVGTTPGNPILVQQFNNAQSDLDQIEDDVSTLNQLAQGVANDSSMSAFLAESASAAFGVSGAVDEDHRQLAILQDEVNRTVVLIERLLKEVTEDVRRQTSYVATERSNLNLLAAGIKSGEIYGVSLVNQAMASAAAGRNANVAGAPVDTTGRRPLVVIRFDRTTVPYEQALFNAVSKALERRPDAVFDLVAVAPATNDEAKAAINSSKSRRNAENVLRSLVDMGLPPSRVAISSKMQDTARVNEVHLYIR
ncbi:MAG: hypothetical protein RIC16_05915 [Rhodospirillales bacterium]